MSNDDKKGMNYFFLISDTWVQGIQIAVSFSILVLALLGYNFGISQITEMIV